jgi:hypothetical protein
MNELMNEYLSSRCSVYIKMFIILRLVETFFDVCENGMFITEFRRAHHLTVPESVEAEDTF